MNEPLKLAYMDIKVSMNIYLDIVIQMKYTTFLPGKQVIICIFRKYVVLTSYVPDFDKIRQKESDMSSKYFY